MIRAIALAVVITLASLGGKALPAQAADSTWGTGGSAVTRANGIGWYYSETQEAFFRTPSSFQPGSDEPELEWSYVPTCDGNAPGGNGNACTAALCTAPGDTPGVSFWVFSRPLDPPGSAWNITGTQCIPGEQRVDLADVEAQIRRIIEDRFREIAEPKVETAPATGALVHVPVLAWTPDPGDVTLQIEQPLPGEVRASPSFAWQWSNGTTSAGPGRAYTAALSPTRTPDHYVHSVFDERGDASVTLTVTWAGDVTVPGLPPIEIAPLVYTAPATFTVLEARAQLVDGVA